MHCGSLKDLGLEIRRYSFVNGRFYSFQLQYCLSFSTNSALGFPADAFEKIMFQYVLFQGDCEYTGILWAQLECLQERYYHVSCGCDEFVFSVFE